VKGIDDTSNFDEFPESNFPIPDPQQQGNDSAPTAAAAGDKELVFLNYTFKRFDGMTQRLASTGNAAPSDRSAGGHSRSQLITSTQLDSMQH